MKFWIGHPTSLLIKEWEKAKNYYCGKHTKCRKHKPSSFVWKDAHKKIAINALKKFLDDTSFIFN